MTKELEEYRAQLRDALTWSTTKADLFDVFNAARALLRVIDALGEEIPEEYQITDADMVWLTTHNSYRQQIIDAILNKG